jgi:tricorn protease
MPWLRACLLAVFVALFANAIGFAQQAAVHFARTPDISPDGKWIAFSYLGDIWVVDAAGGIARQLTTHEAHEINPAFSPDGRHIAFSSNRHGSYDVFTVPFQGGTPRRLTYDSGADMVNSWTHDGTQVLFTTRRGESFPLTSELYTVPARGGREQRLSVFEGRDGSFDSLGEKLVYVRGPGTWYRRGYKGSSNDDIWICDADGGNNRRLTATAVQEGSPLWSKDGKRIYFVSEAFGAANLCWLPAETSLATGAVDGKPRPMTKHVEHVRRARLSANGAWFVYECGADLYVAGSDGRTPPRKLRIEAYADDKSNPDRTTTFTQGLTDYAISSDERHIVCVVHGELFLIPMSGGTARRLTDHRGNDHSPAWAPDRKKIAFISDRDGQENIYTLEQDDPENPELTRATRFKVMRLTNIQLPDAAVSYSPDGTRMAFLRGGMLWTMKPDGTDEKPLVGQTRVMEYDWSPDSKWIAYSRVDPMFASEIYIVPAAGGDPVNVTRYATRNFSITWSQDGTKLSFVSQRRQDLDVFVLNLQKPAAEGAPASKPGDIDFEDIHHRVTRVTSLSSDETDAVLKPDGTQVVFRSNALGADDLWYAAANGGQITRVTTGGTGPKRIKWTRLGLAYYLDANGALRFVRPGAPPAVGAATLPNDGRVPFTAKMKINRDELFTQMFEEGWRKLQYHFYDPKHHGANWTEVRRRYGELVKHVCMHEDFYDLVSLMLGELNASHLGISGKARTAEEQTADLGIFWDHRHRGVGLKVAGLLRGGPADRRGVIINPGEYVLSINGVDLNDEANLSQLLNEKAGEAVVLQVASDPKSKPRKVVIRPMARTATANLYYQQWVADNAKRVHEMSGGKLGYIHIKAMDAPSLDDFVRNLYSDHFYKEGIVIDVRYNGGGFTHDQVLAYLGGKEHTFFVAREGERGPVLRANDRKYTRPLVVLMNNRSYSDAEIFPHAFRTLGLGKLVGLPTGGYVIGTVNDRLIDGSSFRLPRLGVFTSGGVNMEKEGVKPDVLVDLHPDEYSRGDDAQIKKAIEVLRQDVAEWKKKNESKPTGE